MNEIINIEKMNDNNFYVNLELETLKELRLVYYRFTDKEIAKEQINSLCFNRLTRSFIILAFLDIIPPNIR
jgi:hypothetical protein